MQTPPEIDLYPVRPRWLPGDSLAGWCWRIYALNGYAPVIHSAAKGLWTQRDLCRVDLVTAGRLIGAKVVHAIRESEERLIMDVVSGGRFGYRATRHRFCPVCMGDHQRHKVVWDLPLVTACPDHGCMLIDRCDQCHRPVSWTRIDPKFTCSCKRVLRHAAQRAGRAEWRFACAVAGATDAHATTRATARVEAGGQSSRVDYAARDIYELLGWADSWTPRHRKKELVPPSLLELVGGDLERMVRVMWRLLRRKRPQSKDVLIDVERDDATRTWYMNKDRISRCSNPLLLAVGAAASCLEKRYLAGIASLPLAAFEPSLSLEDRRLADACLGRWWRELVQCLQAADSEPLLGTRAPAADRLRLLNCLYQAALQEVPVKAFSTLAARWQVPPMLRSVASASELGAGFAELHAAEHEFLFALLEHDLTKWRRSMGNPAMPRPEPPDG